VAQRAITSRDVARTAGVSQATVAAFLNGTRPVSDAAWPCSAEGAMMRPPHFRTRSAIQSSVTRRQSMYGHLRSNMHLGVQEPKYRAAFAERTKR
jgi:hypothetical protein